MCADKRHISKICYFRQKNCFKIKISVPFVRCTSYGETTMYITCLNSISASVNNMEAVQRSWVSQLYFEILPFLAKNGKNPPKKKATL